MRAERPCLGAENGIGGKQCRRWMPFLQKFQNRGRLRNILPVDFQGRQQDLRVDARYSGVGSNSCAIYSKARPFKCSAMRTRSPGVFSQRVWSFMVRFRQCLIIE